MNRFARRLLSLLVLLIAAGCATSRFPPPAAAPAPYIRVTQPDTNTFQLEVAVRKFLPDSGKGPALWLVGASHIGETNYFQTIQQMLEPQSVVLFEGVGSGNRTMKERVHQRSTQPPPANDPGNLQTTLATSLGLIFQLDAIDYDRPNFQNSDLTLQDLVRLMQHGGTNSAVRTGPESPGGKPTAGGNESFNQLLDLMDGSSFLGSVVQMGLRFIGSSSKLQALTKLAMIETLGAAGNDLANFKGLPPDMQELMRVLIHERNQHVTHDLQTALQQTGRNQSIAVLYGAGHMADLEKRVRNELHYHPAKDVWLVAFSVDVKRSGLEPYEVDMVRSLIKSQLQLLQPAENQ